VAFTLRRGAGPAGAGDRGAADGSMTLMEHLNELRMRLFRAVLAIAVASVVCAFFYDEIVELLTTPFVNAVEKLAAERNIDAKLTFSDMAGPFTLTLKTSLVAGLVVASPIWLWQIWAFVVPGLHSTERRWSVIFASVAGPLFIGGVLLGFFVLPKGLGILLDFTPTDVSNFVNLDKYLTFIMRMLLVFGVSFEIPLFVILLNLAGVVSGKSLGQHRSWIVLGVFVFAAIATPSTDPISMLFLAVPMTVLFLMSEVVARLIDRRRAKRGGEGDYSAYSDDEASEIGADDFDDTDAFPDDTDEYSADYDDGEYDGHYDGPHDDQYDDPHDDAVVDPLDDDPDRR
jgi:sec-independent protein translocase protein TatC